MKKTDGIICVIETVIQDDKTTLVLGEKDGGKYVGLEHGDNEPDWMLAEITAVNEKQNQYMDIIKKDVVDSEDTAVIVEKLADFLGVEYISECDFRISVEVFADNCLAVHIRKPLVFLDLFTNSYYLINRTTGEIAEADPFIVEAFGLNVQGVGDE